MITWLTAKAALYIGDKFARPVTIGVLILLAVLAVFLVGRCTAGDDTDGAQIDQTTRSSGAIADAAADAIKTLEGRTATEDAVDQATQETLNEIEGAVSPTAVRNAVLAGVCARAEHRNDPACTSTAESRLVGERQ